MNEIRFVSFQYSGPPLPKKKFILAINSIGITFLDEREKTLLVLSYPELTGVNTVRWAGHQFMFDGLV